MITIKDIYIKCHAFWYADKTCPCIVCKHCPKDNVCLMLLDVIHDLLEAGEYH